ncbi:hypothetical protein [Methanosarcina barkeri]|uniref:hypothetical protein n=1 Tax=Methanosarcina barkeri TaxID=2208 RepID=UPI001FB2CD19|nr:hypothetical protein [Methanosarcina barkeri]
MNQSDCTDIPCMKEASIEGFSEKQSEAYNFEFPKKLLSGFFRNRKVSRDYLTG